MEYINVSSCEEMVQLEQEVGRELESMEKVITKNTVHEPASSWLKNQARALKLDMENKIKDIHNEITQPEEELTSINNKKKHLHETVVFLGNQLNSRMSTESAKSIEDSSLFLNDIINKVQTSDSTNDDLLKSTQDRVRFLQSYCIEQSRTIQQSIEAKF